MMNVPVEIINYYDSKIPVTMSSAYGVTSDVVRCRLNDTWMLLYTLYVTVNIHIAMYSPLVVFILMPSSFMSFLLNAVDLKRNTNLCTYFHICSSPCKQVIQMYHTF